MICDWCKDEIIDTPYSDSSNDFCNKDCHDRYWEHIDGLEIDGVDD